MQSRTLAGGLLLAAVMLSGFGVDQQLHLGRSAIEADAIAPHVRVDREAPSIAVKITNRTGKEALLAGWLGDKMATAKVPARSAIIELSWDSIEGDSADLRLRLYPDSGGVPRISDAAEPGQAEDHVVELKSRGDYTTPPTTAPPTTAPPTTAPPTTAPPTTAPPTTAPPTTAPPTPSRSPLPVTGTNAWPYVQLGSGVLGFGMVMVGLAWALGRWRRDSSTAR